jgi:hypothetical protein
MSPVEHARPILECKNLVSIGVTLGTTFIILHHHVVDDGRHSLSHFVACNIAEKRVTRAKLFGVPGRPLGTIRSRNRSHVEQSFAGGAETYRPRDVFIDWSCHPLLHFLSLVR